MSTCPVSHLRPELTALPARIAKLPVDRGYPVPWFVPQVDGKYEFRAADARKRVQAVKERLCWVCGERLGRHLVFVIGPMCGITRSTVEPACHLECARWSAINCPFLARPHMVRRENDLPEGIQDPDGIAIKRNPGATILWTTESFQAFKDHSGGWLIEMGQPTAIEAYAEGRKATSDEVLHSIDTGLSLLREQCEKESTPGRILQAYQELTKQHYEFLELLQKLCFEGGL